MNSIRFYSCFICLLFCSNSIQSQNLTLNKHEITKLQQLIKKDSSAAKQFKGLLNLADQSLKDSPNPIIIITSEGRLAGDPLKTATANALKDIRKMYALSMVYRITNNDNYCRKAEEFLIAWAKKNQPTGDPIDETNLDGAFESYDLLKDKLSAKDRSVITRWFRNVADTEINYPRMVRLTKSGRYDNWNSHRLKIIGEVAWLLNDETYKKFITDNLPLHIAGNIYPDGSSFDFTERDAFHYHIYDIEPLIKLSILIQRAGGPDYYHFTASNQASIAKSIDFMVPFVNGEKTHAEFVNTKISFDLKRAKNNEASYKIGHLFDPAEALQLFTLAAKYDPTLIEIVRKLKKDDQRFPYWQAVLNEF